MAIPIPKDDIIINVENVEMVAKLLRYSRYAQLIVFSEYDLDDDDIFD